MDNRGWEGVEKDCGAVPCLITPLLGTRVPLRLVITMWSQTGVFVGPRPGAAIDQQLLL